MRTLIVEDDEASGIVLESFLAPIGENVRAKDGEQGLEAFRAAFLAGKPFDLVCLDIMMPIMDGQTTLKKIREFESENNVPTAKAVKVIMTTALGDKDNVIEALPRCDAYLQKPVNRLDLLFYVKKFGLMRAADAEEAAERDRKRAAAKEYRKRLDQTWLG
jgi:two-component system, chemotaxis family, chemotaxis protein CheY